MKGVTVVILPQKLHETHQTLAPVTAILNMAFRKCQILQNDFDSS